MNWLIYIPGWIILGEIVFKICKITNTSSWATPLMLIWTLFWIGICWKYIN